MTRACRALLGIARNFVTAQKNFFHMNLYVDLSERIEDRILFLMVYPCDEYLILKSILLILKCFVSYIVCETPKYAFSDCYLTRSAHKYSILYCLGYIILSKCFRIYRRLLISNMDVTRGREYECKTISRHQIPFGLKHQTLVTA